MDTTTLKLRGMSCASCANSIEETINSVSGVSECNVNFGAEQATVKYNPQKTDIKQIQDAVDAAGYSATPLQEQEMITGEDDEDKASHETESSDLKRKVIVGGVISLILIKEGRS